MRQLNKTIAGEPPTPGPLQGGLCEGRWFSFYDAGPFESQDELFQWWNDSLQALHRSDAVQFAPEKYRLVFTHGDFLPRNLIIDHSGRIWVVDWELAGWYPDFLEYAYIRADAHRAPSDWVAQVLEFFPDYQREYEKFKGLTGFLDVNPFAARNLRNDRSGQLDATWSVPFDAYRRL